MTLFRDRLFLRLALSAALAASFGLAACGRKGPLDLPPAASVNGEPQAQAQDVLSPPMASPIGSKSDDANPGVDKNGNPIAPKGPKKSIPLDVLLN